MNSQIRRKVVDKINTWVNERISAIQTERPKWIKNINSGKSPFHTPLLSLNLTLPSKFERSYSTSTGKLFQSVSEIVGSAKYDISEQEHKTFGYIPKDTLSAIDSIINNLNSGGTPGSYYLTVTNLVNSVKNDLSERKQITVQSDLYLKSKENETFIELKAPLPNKGQCQRMLRDSLKIHCMLKSDRPKVRTYVGMPYNPYGEGNDYVHSFAVKNLDVKYHVKLGKSYWDMVGGAGTYEELLQIFKNVGNSGARSIIEKAVLLGQYDYTKKSIS